LTCVFTVINCRLFCFAKSITSSAEETVTPFVLLRVTTQSSFLNRPFRYVFRVFSVALGGLELWILHFKFHWVVLVNVYNYNEQVVLSIMSHSWSAYRINNRTSTFKFVLQKMDPVYQQHR
jgi:hypothetical protein